MGASIEPHYAEIFYAKNRILGSRERLDKTSKILLRSYTKYIYTYMYIYIYTQRNIFEILLNQPEIRLYLPFSD